MCLCILAFCVCIYAYVHTHIYVYMHVSLYTHRCVHTYISTCIEYWCVLWIYRDWKGYSWNADLKSPSQPQWQKMWQNPEAVKESLNTCCIQKTPTVYSAYSLFFFKERKWQKENSRDLAKFQDLLERRRLVGCEKSVEITGSLFRKCLCFVFLVMWQEKRLS